MKINCINEKHLKYIKEYYRYILIIVIPLIIIFVILKPSQKEVRNAKEKFNNILDKKIIRITIYCLNGYGENYKIDISDYEIIKHFVDSSRIIYSECSCKYRFKQHYLIKFYAENGDFFSILYEKKCTAFSIKNCNKFIQYNGKKINNPYNDCGCLSFIKNPKITEEEYRYNSIPDEIVAFDNIDLIPIIIKYADEVVKQNHEKYYFHFKY